MTFRAKPAVKRAHRPSWEGRDRRNLYLNLGFVAVIAIALLTLAAAAGVSYYGDHFAKVALVNGTAITKDALRDRVKVDTFRLDHLESLLQDQVNTGKIDQASADQQRQQVTTLRNKLPQSSLDNLVDATLQAQLAAQQGVAVTDQQVADELTTEATSPELRHTWVISVAPEVSAGTSAPTDRQKADAKAKADKALADLTTGKKWEDIAKAVSGDSSAAKGGDLGWSTKSGGADTAFQAALFAAQVNAPTAVMEGADGTFRIGRVTEIQKESVDADYQQKIRDAGVSIDAYRTAVQADLIRTGLGDKITSAVVDTASVMRDVSEIYLQATPGAAPADEVKSAHILISPNGDPAKAKDVAAGDPAWKTAQDAADQIYAALQKDPTKFVELAQTKSDDKGSGASGGTLPWFKEADVDPAFGQAVFAPGLTPGQILAPVKSQFGWHVIRFDARRADASVRIKELHDKATAPGADFAALAAAGSDGSTAAGGGKLGWIAHNQIDKAQEDIIFKTAVGDVSAVLTSSSGYYIFKVWQEQTRKPEADQATTLKASAFDNWYAAQKKVAVIVEDNVGSTATQ